MEFEEARKELQAELEKGASLDEIRTKITKGEIQTKVVKQLKTKKYFHVERIQRKKRDLMQLINRNVAENIVEQSVDAPKTLTVMDRYAKAREEYDTGLVLSRTIYKIADNDLLVRQFHLPVVFFSFCLFLLAGFHFIGKERKESYYRERIT